MKFIFDCIITHKVVIEAKTLEEAFQKSSIEEIEADIFENGSDDYQFKYKLCRQ